MLKQFENVDEKRDGKLQKRDGKLQQTRDEILGRPVTNQYVEKESFEYNMNYPRRGKCLVFYFSTFHPRVKLENRRCAEEDKNNIKRSFGHLGFEVEEHHNFSRDNVLQTIQKVSEEDHSDCDCLALVFMSHGTFDENTKEQWLWTFDDKIYPQDLWKNFTGSKCLSLAGKPKLFFIQACRGPETDRGVAVTKAMRVVTDGVVVRPLEKRYTLPSHADMLIMWASFPGHFAFKSNNGGIRGSVFIHFLSKVFAEEGTKESLASLLLLVTRNVALEFESFNPYVERIDSNKQIPMTESTLLRHTYFKPKTDVKML